MKYLRTFILVLLTVLLPVRGAVAAAMLCPGDVSTISTVGNAGPGQQAMHEGHCELDAHHAANHTAHHTATEDHSHGQSSDEPTSDTHSTTCQFCAGGCCVTPLAFAAPAVQRLSLFSSAGFAEVTACFTAFYPDGQDRPPRSI